MTKQEIQEHIIKLDLVDDVYCFCDDIGLTEEEKCDFVEWYLFEKEYNN